MIIEYHRPKTIEEVLLLLTRHEPRTYPLGGGTFLNRPSAEQYAVVDLQELGLDEIHERGNLLEIGASASLEKLSRVNSLPPSLKLAIKFETSYHIQHVATVAGTLIASGGRSPFTTTMLALDAGLVVQGLASAKSQVNDETVSLRSEKIDLGDLLPLHTELLQGRLITQLTIPLNVNLAYEYVARTPADQPIVCVAVAHWHSGRTRVVLGGYGAFPCMAMDGPDAQGAELAATSVYSQADDEWASAEYRQEMARLLTQRCVAQVLS